MSKTTEKADEIDEGIEKEIKEKRTRTSKIYDLGGGHYQAVLYPEPVHERNASGEWETVELASTDGFDGYSVIYEKDGTLEYSFIVTKTESDVTYRVSVE